MSIRPREPERFSIATVAIMSPISRSSAQTSHIVFVPQRLLDKKLTRKNNYSISAMDYMYISPDLQHKDPMRNVFTELSQADMNVYKC
jgi:hypothetical protein